ncbi:hypothetical protein DSM106972_066280 [Dulcicalothrix desertica PCC 7102]|uniref:DUF305 domain-containing protein n=1 Tax=Dulcicalothrix desertica PCC 7102 TaxID=232991 RepID=A0A433V654_9CYAN|nr:DUF305 domain-containing protein [Dulcicalothrix desertica]RUT01531.1 hypothetical protein DSM106972_066280 [Dulcicalothrix desertica PCC 7102]
MSNSDTIRQSLSLNPTWSSSQSIFEELNFNIKSSLPSFTLTANERSARFDVRFLQETIGHHMMAVDMAKLSVDKAVNQDLRDLSQNIITTQSQEIETMQSWLKDWYGLSYEPEMKPGDQRMLDQMAKLNGADFEIDFMQEMTDHHKSMLSDAVPCVSRAGHTELSDLCQNIAKTQSSEINQMQTWLSERYGITDDNSIMGMSISGTTDYRNNYSNNYGQIVNGGFENGDFTGWSATGKAMLETSNFGSEPSEGKYYAALSTQFDTVPSYDIESFLNLPYGSLKSLGNGNIDEGSAMKTSFTAKAGDVLSFDWNFMTNEKDSTLAGDNKDFGFITLNSLPYNATDTSSSLQTSLTPFSDETGFKTLSIEIPFTGTYTLGLGVVNLGDPIYDSAFAIDNVKLLSVYDQNSISKMTSNT